MPTNPQGLPLALRGILNAHYVLLAHFRIVISTLRVSCFSWSVLKPCHVLQFMKYVSAIFHFPRQLLKMVQYP